MDDSSPTSRLVTEAHCTLLRHKGMYVTSAEDPGEYAFYDRYDATAYWCLRTQKPLGPDGEPVHPDRCQGERGCCRH